MQSESIAAIIVVIIAIIMSIVSVVTGIIPTSLKAKNTKWQKPTYTSQARRINRGENKSIRGP